MRIALLSHLASRAAPTGAERSLALLAEGLARRGHEVTVIAPGRWVLAEQLAQAGVGVRIVPTSMAWLVWYEERASAYAAAKWARTASVAMRGRARLARELSSLAPEVVHVNCLPHVHGARAARRLGLKVVWHLREILPAGPRRGWFARRLATDADRIVAVSDAVAAWVREEGLAERVEVVHNGVAIPDAVPDRAAARRALGLPFDEGCVVGLFGQLEPHKGAGLFLEAARRALAATGEAEALRFVVAGRGPRAHVAELRAATERLAGKALILPPQPGAEQLLASADVVTLTTVSPDPLPRAVLEAMAYGRPVVAFDSGGTREMVVDGETGILCGASDVDALAAAFVRLARDPRERAAMGRRGRARAAAEFSLERHLDRMERVLQRAAGGA